MTNSNYLKNIKNIYKIFAHLEPESNGAWEELVGVDEADGVLVVAAVPHHARAGPGRNNLVSIEVTRSEVARCHLSGQKGL